MAGEWKEVTLLDVCEITVGFPFKSDRYAPVGIRLLRGDNIAQGTTRWEGTKMWPSDDCSGLEAYMLQVGDVVLAMDRPWIAAGLKYAELRQTDVPSLLVQRVARLKGKPGISTKFIGYVIGSADFTNYILSIQTGTAVPHISAAQIQDYRFKCPGYDLQKIIASILGSLDDKIELNRQTCETLESMARALFKSWFVDFDPVRAKAEGRTPAGMDAETAALFPSEFEPSDLGPIPKGWALRPLGQLVEFHDSRRVPLSKMERVAMSGSYPYYGAAGIVDHINRFIFDGTYVLAGEDGSVIMPDQSPVLQYVRGKFWVNNHAHVLGGRANISTEHIYLRLKHTNVAPYITGAVQAKISQGRMQNIPIIHPPFTITASFDHLIAPIFDRVMSLRSESVMLAEMRDLLIPALLGGAAMGGMLDGNTVDSWRSFPSSHRSGNT